MNASCAGIGFHSNSLISCDADANVYEWDIVGGRCRFKFKDNHSVHISSFALSHPFGENVRNAFLANGSTSGFLNVYPMFSQKDDQSHLVQNELVKSFGNLSTEVTSIATDSTGNFIVYSSVHKRNALRIVYTPSFKVIANWPTDKINLGRVTSLSFCSQQNTLAIGNKRGKIQFYKIIA
ncbi:hypothetical protein BEWA_026600 [Theileria equi strain WA]|uniref:Uncharacterized protein n=1 Tax=Theileria equi strain WA TaxID=1537102 RepID=L0AXR6_THEEQ|nr:hypothetical protein BEWA_026600 [Theileria equi strain WA]AFZ79811.1 hypothetical protein BEWA_026600 [Theileria equi strain WA]|eukprot:XP_004829477.1 hypothetical protein BEWA_026600 [Theileria equi strain WA]